MRTACGFAPASARSIASERACTSHVVSRSRDRRLDVRVAASRQQAQQHRSPRPENAPGSFSVDHTCIDCDTCRWMAPATFARVGDMSAVVAQPQAAAERHAAMQALLSCPTFSIHCSQRQAGELRAAQESFPLLVPGCRHVYHCGFAAEASFGATSYFIQRPQGNILVDVPRWTPLLAQRLQQLGGVAWVFLTHRDDVGDHAAWARHFGAQRIIHRSEANRRQGTDQCEVLLDGEGPWQLPTTSRSPTTSSPASRSSSGSSSNDADAVKLTGNCYVDDDDDVQLVFTPGHTAGCVSLLYRPDSALFSGDHLAWSHRLQRLTIFRAYNWHSVAQQLESVAQLRQLDFLHVLPGHGRRASFGDGGEREQRLQELLAAEGYTAAASATAAGSPR